jgi:Na+-driven multidrug efflux pump
VKDVLIFSWPVMLDKATLAAAKMVLGALIAPMGKYALASFAVIKDMEQLAFVPAIAFAQVITLLVSNAYGKKDWNGIKGTIRKVLFLTSLCVMAILILFSLFPVQIIQIFDTKGAFTSFAAVIFPLLSVLVFFDLLQLILAGALRGAGDVRTVMWVRLAVFVGYFIPVSYGISLLPLESVLLKFFLLYAAFYVGNGLMGIMYILRFRGDAWKSIAIER